MEVPAPDSRPPRDIAVYLAPKSVADICMSCFFTMRDLVDAGGLVGSSLQETRTDKEFLDLLKTMIIPDDFHLQTLQDRQVVDVEGIIRPGDYLVGMFGILMYYVPLLNLPSI